MYVSVCMCGCLVYIYIYLFVRLRATVFRTRLGDPDPIRIRVRSGPDTMAIRRPIPGMIRRSVPVRAVKTRWRFGSETASFHVSVCFCLISLIIIVYT